MAKQERCIELRNSLGKTLFGLYIFDRDAESESKPKPAETPKPEPKKQEGKKNGNKGAKAPEKTPAGNPPPPLNGDPMTAPQKRYLFRLLADQGMEGDSAYQYLKDHFQVNALSEITKLEASRVIDRLVTEAQGGENARPPF
jgi:hypothetical protein